MFTTAVANLSQSSARTRSGVSYGVSLAGSTSPTWLLTCASTVRPTRSELATCSPTWTGRQLI
eukprot:5002501-Amphidinium_carterae.1